MYKTLDDMKCARALNSTLCIAATLHDMLHYLCAHSKLGTPRTSLSQKRTSVSADWGGSEGVGQFPLMQSVMYLFVHIVI